MVWFITGGAGMLAEDMRKTLEEKGIQYVSATRAELDVSDTRGLQRWFERIRPTVVVNCAAYTAVDNAEKDEAAAFRVNATGVENLARACAETGATLVQISTDYVFDGEAKTPYREDDPLSPLGAYGRTKAAGEWAGRASNPKTYVVRTAWLYGAGGPCFPKTMARLLESRGEVDVVADQTGQPTWTSDVARIVADLVLGDAPYGTYHATSSGQTTWFGFTEAIAESIGAPKSCVKPVTSEEFTRPAPRPTYSVLGHEALTAAGVLPIGNWKDRWQVAAPQVLKRIK